MKVKVCGMKCPDNIVELMKLPIDMMGIIFYPQSPRYLSQLALSDVSTLPPSMKRVGVFVNADINCILEKTNEYALDIVQLHGNESPEFCKKMNETISVIKAFSVVNESDLEQTEAYQGLCDYFLFDTKTPDYGGSGQKFDWKILDNYHGNTPFLLSGGISADDAQAVKSIKHPMLYGIDLNSRFEISPGVKNIELLEQFINEIKS